MRWQLVAVETFHDLVGEAEFFAVDVFFFGEWRAIVDEAMLKVGDVAELGEEPLVDHGESVHFIDAHAAVEPFVNSEKAQVGGAGHEWLELVQAHIGEIWIAQGVLLDLSAAHSFHKAHFEAVGDGHDFAGGFHLGAEVALGVDEFVKRPFWEFDGDVVEGWLEGREGFSGDDVWNLVEGVAEGDLCGDLGDRITGGFGCQSGGAGHAWVDFDDGVFKAFRMQRKLHIAATFDAEGVDDVQRSGAQHLVFLVSEGDGWCDDDGVAGMNADGVEVFHGADGDGVALGVADDFEFNLFPAADAFFNEDLVDRRSLEAVVGDLVQRFGVVADAAAGAAEGEGWAHDDRIADLVGVLQRADNVGDDFGGDGWLADGVHRVFEHLAVFGFVDGFRICAKELDVMTREESFLGELHGKGEPGLAAKGGEDGVWAFFLDDALDRLQGQRLDVDVVGHGFVGHDGSRIGVDENDVDVVLLEGLAGLGAGVVKFCCLADDDRAGADDEYFFDLWIEWHSLFYLHHVKESVEKEFGVFWSAAGFWMILHAEGWLADIVDAFAGAVVGIDEALCGDSWIDGVVIDGVAVVLAGDEDAVGDEIAHWLVGAAVTVFELEGGKSVGQREQLVTKADAEGWQLVSLELFQLSDDVLRFLRIARAVGEHEGVWLLREDLFAGAFSRHADDGGAAAGKLTLDVVLGAEIPEHDAWALFGSWYDLDAVGGHRWHSLTDGEISKAVGDGFFRIGGEDSVHDAVLADALGEGAGVDAVEADDVLTLQVSVEAGAAAEVGWQIAWVLDDVAAQGWRLRFKIFRDDADVADEREGLENDLTVVAWVGQGFQVASHGGGEDEFGHDGAFGAERFSLENGAVFEAEVSFFTQMIRAPLFIVIHCCLIFFILPII